MKRLSSGTTNCGCVECGIVCSARADDTRVGIHQGTERVRWEQVSSWYIAAGLLWIGGDCRPEREREGGGRGQGARRRINNWDAKKEHR